MRPRMRLQKQPWMQTRMRLQKQPRTRPPTLSRTPGRSRPWRRGRCLQRGADRRPFVRVSSPCSSAPCQFAVLRREVGVPDPSPFARAELARRPERPSKPSVRTPARAGPARPEIPDPPTVPRPARVPARRRAADRRPTGDRPARESARESACEPACEPAGESACKSACDPTRGQAPAVVRVEAPNAAMGGARYRYHRPRIKQP